MNFSIDSAAMEAALTLMWQGMAGIFVVMIVITVLVAILTRMHK